MMLRRSIVELLLGVVLLGEGASLLLFQVGRTQGFSPSAPVAEPFPHALVGIGILLMLMFTLLLLALIYRINWDVGSDDLDDVTLDQHP